MAELLTVILNIYLASVGVAGVTKFLKERKARKIIEKKGYKIVSGEKEPQEFIADFFKNNFYVIVPFRNIKKTWKLIWGSNKKYANAKMEELKKEGRLEAIEETKQIEKPVEVKKEEKIVEKKENKIPEKKVTETKPKNIASIVDEFKNEINTSNDLIFVDEVRKTYRQKSNDLRQQYAVLSKEYKETTDKTKKAQIKDEVSNICRKIRTYDELYICARTRLTELKNTPVQRNRK